MLEKSLDELPPETKLSVQEQLWLPDQVRQSINKAEKRVTEVIKMNHTLQLLQTLPGVRPILAIVITLEVESIDRFATAKKLASYAGKVPRVNSSRGKTCYGKVSQDVNRYLKWAFPEAANAIVMQQERRPDCHVVRLYRRVRKHKGHAKAITAVGRHFAEATFWVLRNNEPYREPKRKWLVSYTQG